MDEITKISRTTGNIIWRLGGKHNQFTFTNDPTKFSYQHDARRIANGHITVFDNGNFNSPPRTYAKEYSLDEVNKIATLTWSYGRTIAAGNLFASAMGSVQRLDNGNTFICWGLIQGAGYPNLTEVDANNNVVWELKLGNADGIYRSTRHVWNPCARPTLALLKIKNITSTTAKVTWAPATNALSYTLQYKKKSATSWTTVNTNNVNKNLTGLSPSTVYKVRVRSKCSASNGSVSKWTSKQFTTKPQKAELTEEGILASYEIFPNPAKGMVQLQFELNEDDNVTISIYDLIGQLVYSSSARFNEGNQSLQLDLQKLTAGLYITEIKSSSDKLRKPLVIQ
jgi:hypothetical protein